MPSFSPLIEHAVELAAQWHEGTYRKGMWRDPTFETPEGTMVRVPVMAHLTAVAMTVQRAGFEDEVVAAAFLHDALEDENRYDQRLRSGQLHEEMGEEVTQLVQFVSEIKLNAEGHYRPWRARKEDYVATLECASTGAVGISLADKLHNLWTMNQSLERNLSVFAGGERRTGLSAGPEEQRWFYRAVLRATCSAAPKDERINTLRDRLTVEIERFETITKQNA